MSVIQVLINLPVADLPRAREFYAALGFVVEDAPEQYAEKMASATLAPGVFVCLLTRDYFATFARKPVVNARAGTQVINALGLESRDAVDALVKKAAAAGGRECGKPREMDGGAVYLRNFVDPDGHQWEIHCMAEDGKAAKAKAAKAKAKAKAKQAAAKQAAKKKAAKPAAKPAAKKAAKKAVKKKAGS